MASAEYRFNRSKDVSGFLSQNTPSTDALNALQRWSGGQKGRSYKKKIDEDELLIAQLSWEEGDVNAGPDLDAQCSKCGVERYFEGN